MTFEIQSVYLIGALMLQLVTVLSVFVKLENRLTKMETSLDFIRNSPQLTRQIREK